MKHKKKQTYIAIALLIAVCAVVFAVVILVRKIGRTEAVTILGAEADSNHVSRPVEYLWDEKVDTKFWSSDKQLGPEQITVTIRLEKPCNVCGVELYPCMIEGKVCYFPKNFTISVSADGEIWKEVQKETDYQIDGTKGQMFSFKQQNGMEYIRLQMTAETEKEYEGSYYVRLGEVIVYARGK